MSYIRKAYAYWLPVIAWAALIFYFSSVPSLESGFAVPVDLLLRKGAHVFVYAVLSGLIARALRKGHNLPLSASLAFAGTLSLAYAFSDEFHQRFVTGRTGRIEDVLVDVVGIVIGLTASGWILKRGR